MNEVGTAIWNGFENILKFLAFKVLRLKLQDEIWEKMMQFVKFALVGLSNVVVSYGVYLIFFLVFQIFGVLPNTDYLVAQLIGYVLSIFWSFYWNRKYVFKADKHKVPWQTALIKSFLSYSFTGVFLNSLLSYVWVEIIGIPKIIAPIINLMINVPVNFLMNKFWAFKGKREVDDA